MTEKRIRWRHCVVSMMSNVFGMLLRCTKVDDGEGRICLGI